LIRAADAEIADRGIESIQMEAVAIRAGVSRATAFRHLGNISEMLLQVALLRGRRHTALVESLIATKIGVFNKIETALLYTSRELPTDPSMSALIARRSASVHHPRVHRLALDSMGPVLLEGQRNGEVRTDLDIDEMIDFLVEQTYLAADDLDRSDAAIHRRFRHFIVPALAANNGSPSEKLSLTQETEDLVAIAINALSNLAGHLQGGKRREDDQE
jgi:AcrR family transcriptional regulator